jgi:hypothetical protein
LVEPFVLRISKRSYRGCPWSIGLYTGADTVVANLVRHRPGTSALPASGAGWFMATSGDVEGGQDRGDGRNGSSAEYRLPDAGRPGLDDFRHSRCNPEPAATPSDTPSASQSPPSASPSPALARVPSVEGLDLGKAKRKLRSADLQVGEVDRRPSSKRKNTVLEQGVATGTELEPGASVPLVVAAPLPRVPSVVGKPEASAIRNLKNAGFKVKKTTQTRTTGQDGVVLSQSRPGGTRAKPNSVVRIVISNVQRRSDAGASRNCTPGYSPCLPPASDYDCRGGSGNGPKYSGPVRVTGPIRTI